MKLVILFILLFLQHFILGGPVTDNSSTVIIPGSVTLPFNSGDELAAVNKNGIVCGSVTWTGSPTALNVWGNDGFAQSNYGYKDGEPYLFRWFDGQKERTIYLKFGRGQSFLDTTGVYHPESIQVVSGFNIPINSIGFGTSSMVVLKGDTLDIPVYVTNQETLSAFQIDVTTTGLVRVSSSLASNWTMSTNAVGGSTRVVLNANSGSLPVGTNEVFRLKIVASGPTITLTNPVGAIADYTNVDAALILNNGSLNLLYDSRGDANGDASVDILDFGITLDGVLGKAAYNTNVDLFPFTAKDGKIDVRDLTTLGVAIVSNVWPDNLPVNKTSTDLNFYRYDNRIELDPNIDLKAIQIETTRTDSIVSSSTVITQTSNDTTRTIIYALGGSVEPVKFYGITKESDVVSVLGITPDNTRLILTPVFTVKTGTEIEPGEFNVSNNYPNPFTEETSVPVYLPRGGDVSVNVYDILGRRLLDYTATLSSGSHNLKLELFNLSSGKYFVTLEYEGIRKRITVTKL